MIKLGKRKLILTLTKSSISKCGSIQQDDPEKREEMLIEALGLCKGGEEGRDYIVCRWAYAIYYYCGISQHGVLVSLVLVLVLFVFGTYTVFGFGIIY